MLTGSFLYIRAPWDRILTLKQKKGSFYDVTQTINVSPWQNLRSNHIYRSKNSPVASTQNKNVMIWTTENPHRDIIVLIASFVEPYLLI